MTNNKTLTGGWFESSTAHFGQTTKSNQNPVNELFIGFFIFRLTLSFYGHYFQENILGKKVVSVTSLSYLSSYTSACFVCHPN